MLKEVRRSRYFKCTVCGRKGASVGCAVKMCQRVGHWACLHSNDYVFQHFGNFEAFCPRHSPNQQSVPSQQIDCPICLMPVSPKPRFHQIYCPKCRTYFHRECVQVNEWACPFSCVCIYIYRYVCTEMCMCRYRCMYRGVC